MKISIITATLNNKSGLIRAIESVRSQTYKNVEHIIVDGGSTDGTVEAIHNLQFTIYNLQFVSEADEGIYDAINKGIKLAAGDVIGLLHSDDFYKDEFVLDKYAEAFGQRAVRIVQDGNEIPSRTDVRDLKISLPINLSADRQDRDRNDKRYGDDALTTDNLQPATPNQKPTIDAVYSDLVYVIRKTRDEKRKKNNSESINHSALNIEHSVIRTWKTHKTVSSEQSIANCKVTNHYSLITNRLLLKGWMPPHPALFIRKEIFDKYGLYKTDMKISADYEMVLRLFYKYKITTRYLPITTYCMTVGGASNKSIGNIITKSREDYVSMKMHELPFPFFTLLSKNFRKLPQFLFHKN